MELATLYGTLIHIGLLLASSLCANYLASNVSIITDITESVFRNKLVASLSVCFGVSILGYWFWNIAGRFMYINNILNSRVRMRRNWYIILGILILIETVIYFIMSSHYSIGNIFGILTTSLIFVMPTFSFWLASAIASPLLFKYSSPVACRVRQNFNWLYGNNKVRGK